MKFPDQGIAGTNRIAMGNIDFNREGKNMRVALGDKSVVLNGHQDNDAYRIFTECFKTKTSLSDSDRQAIIEELRRRNESNRYPPIIID